jgi:serine/threonine protein kinase
MIGKVIGNYKIVEKIGEGGMGAVYRGLDTMLEREVAIKMLRPELASQPDVLERFRTEAVTLAKLNHPNIATLYSFMRDGEDYFMVMEFVRGATLDDVIRRHGAMIIERAVPLFCQALDGIDHAHRMGIIHRDIKPANVMLTEGGSIKVMDFGIARVLGSARMTRAGNVVGTIEYMSPEAVRGLEVDARSDVYSLGILLYEILTGRVPFDSQSEFEMMKMQVEKAPQPPRTFTESIPVEIEQAIMRSLAKKAEARFQTAGEFRAVLLGALGRATTELPLHTANYSAPVTRQMEIPQGGETRALTAEGDGMRSDTRIVGSPGPSSAAFQSNSRDTAGAASMLPTPSNDAPPAQGPAPTVVVNTLSNESPPARTVVVNKLSSEAPAPPAPTQLFQAEAAPVPVAAPAQRKSNWKLYAAAAAVLVVLIGGALAFVMLRSSKPAPAAEPTEQSAPDTSSQPPAQVDSAAPLTNANSNENTAAAGSLTDAANSNANTNANTSKTARARKGNENSNATATAEPNAAAPEQKPAQAEPPAQTPAPETKPANPQQPDQTAAKPEEKKKKGGGIGGFFKKVFGGGDKKKEESKDKKP